MADGDDEDSDDESRFDPALAYARFRDVRAEAVDDAVFLIDRQEQAIHMLNPVGQLVWAALEEPATAGEIADALRQIFPGVAPGVLAADVVALMETLEEHDLIRPAASADYA